MVEIKTDYAVMKLLHGGFHCSETSDDDMNGTKGLGTVVKVKPRGGEKTSGTRDGNAGESSKRGHVVPQEFERRMAFRKFQTGTKPHSAAGSMPQWKPLLCFGILFIFGCVLSFCAADDRPNCSKTNTSLLNYTSPFWMVQHQLRGVVTVIDDCSFEVSQFDMLQGSENVHWWGSSGEMFENLTRGFVISDQNLNQTFRNDTFTVNLIENVTWDQIKVLSVWDVPAASDFGHVVLGSHNYSENFNVTGPLAPTMFDNCKVLSDKYRVRWSLGEERDFVDVGLEAATGVLNYMAFGWANPSASDKFMVGSDVTVTGFREDGFPFAEDYFISNYSECVVNEVGKFEGVCPDAILDTSDNVGLVNNTKLSYGHRKDGVTFIRFRRPLKSSDEKYDVAVDYRAEMPVIWASGLIKPPDQIRPFYLPQYHGGTFGHLILNLSESVNDCLGPLDAEDKEDQDLVIADKEPLVVTTGPALHYPNPPNPSKVFYINKKEAPVLRVERGVGVKFSIQTGHDVALYITSDPVGGNVYLRNDSETETIYFGGPEAEGVKSKPKDLTWTPDRNTPDLVYYQSVYTPKMGWKVQVVDGGLADMYNNSVVLDDQQVTFFWTLSNHSISIAARSEKKSGYLAIGFGREMVLSYAYVGWIDESGKGRVSTYWINGKNAQSLHPTHENLTYARCKSENGMIAFEFTRPLFPSCNKKDIRPECKNIIDPSTPLKVIWARGAQWSDHEHLSVTNMHSVTSKRPVNVLLMRGSAEADEDLRPVLAVHGFMMFLAFGMFLPGGALAARYLKHLEGDGWFQLHVYLQYSGLMIVFLGFIFAVAELQGFVFQSLHVKFGLLSMFLAAAQPANAYFRPKQGSIGDEMASERRLLWAYIHAIVGKCGILVGVAALISGLLHLGERYRDENTRGLILALILWFTVVSLGVMYLEYRAKKRRRERIFGGSHWVLGDGDEEDDDPLTVSEKAFERSEVQLEPLSK